MAHPAGECVPIENYEMAVASLKAIVDVHVGATEMRRIAKTTLGALNIVDEVDAAFYEALREIGEGS